MRFLKDELEQLEDRAPLDHQASVHEQFAELQFRMKTESELGCRIGEPERHPRFAAVAEGEFPAAGGNHLKGPATDGASEGSGEELL